MDRRLIRDGGHEPLSDEHVARRLELAIRLVALIWGALGAPAFAVAAIACGRPCFALGSVAAGRALAVAVAKLVPPSRRSRVRAQSRRRLS
jgi:hypothetical protein